MTRSRMNQISLALVFAGGVLLLVLFGLGSSPPVVEAGLPPRPTAAPTATTPSVQNQPAGAAVIRLQVSAVLGDPTLLGSIVQWQDALGGWHDVEGWQGHLEGEGYKAWWVAPKDYGTGPFRWVVYESSPAVPLVTSDSFNLPSSGHERVLITVTLPDE